MTTTANNTKTAHFSIENTHSSSMPCIHTESLLPSSSSSAVHSTLGRLSSPYRPSPAAHTLFTCFVVLTNYYHSRSLFLTPPRTRYFTELYINGMEHVRHTHMHASSSYMRSVVQSESTMIIKMLRNSAERVCVGRTPSKFYKKGASFISRGAKEKQEEI